MKKKYYKSRTAAVLAVCVILCFPSYASGQEISENKNFGIVPMAAPYYTPDTSVAFAAFVIAYWTPDSLLSSQTQNELGAFVTYTLKNQIVFALSPEIYINGGNQKISAKLSGKKFPSSFWGLGSDTTAGQEEQYRTTEFSAELSILFKIRENLYSGPIVRYMNSSIDRLDNDGLLISGDIPGSSGTTDTGAGWVIQYDTRNSNYYPTEGMLINYEITAYRSDFGGDYNYIKSIIDARFFYGICFKHVIASQVVFGTAAGTVPFQSMNSLGGDDMMRGYNSGRFVDNHSLAAQLEYRFPISGRFAGVVFASAGQVQPEIADLVRLGDLHYSGGLGLRFILDKDQHIALRADLGFDEKGNPNIYFLVREAF